MDTATYDAMEEELERLRTPTDALGRAFLGLTQGPYVMDLPEKYGHVKRIRELRAALAKADTGEN